MLAQLQTLGVETLVQAVQEIDVKSCYQGENSRIQIIASKVIYFRYVNEQVFIIILLSQSDFSSWVLDQE